MTISNDKFDLYVKSYTHDYASVVVTLESEHQRVTEAEVSEDASRALGRPVRCIFVGGAESDLEQVYRCEEIAYIHG